MKRSSSFSESDPSPSSAEEDQKMKKVKTYEEEAEEEVEARNEGLGFLDNNLLFEVLKHADARTLASASCVSRQWHETAQDERLWELICTRHWANIGCENRQLRSVVLALGGFRRLHALYIWPLQRPQPQPQPPSPKPPPPSSSRAAARWGKDEVNLSLSLLSIRFYEKMNYSNRPPSTR